VASLRVLRQNSAPTTQPTTGKPRRTVLQAITSSPSSSPPGLGFSRQAESSFAAGHAASPYLPAQLACRTRDQTSTHRSPDHHLIIIIFFLTSPRTRDTPSQSVRCYYCAEDNPNRPAPTSLVSPPILIVSQLDPRSKKSINND
jgi:hypothetical protein